MQASDRFTADDVASWLSAREVDKARPYLDAVSELDIGAAHIRAKVQGSAPNPYRVAVSLAPNGRNFPQKTSCSCPVGGYCKHVAATLLKTIELRGQPDRVRPAAMEWMEALRQLSSGPTLAATRAKPQQRLFWMLERNAESGEFRLGCLKGRADANGLPAGQLAAWFNFEQALSRPFQFIDNEDLAVLRLLLAQNGRSQYYREDLALVGRHGSEILARLLHTGRLYAKDIAMKPLTAGGQRAASLRWRQDDRGRFRAEARTEPAITWALPLDPPWYLDGPRHEVGELKFELPPAVAARVLAAPPLNEAEARLATSVLAEAAPEVPPPVVRPARVIDCAPVPVLALDTVDVAALHKLRQYARRPWGTALDIAQVRFRYGETEFGPHDAREMVTLFDGEAVRVKRRFDDETRWLADLREHGFEPMPRNAVQTYPPVDVSGWWTLASEEAWNGLMTEGLTRMREAGWDVLLPSDFRHHFLEVESWEAEIAEDAAGHWFDLDMGIIVEGRRLGLAPLLAELFGHDPRWLDAGRLQHIADSESVDLRTPEGQRVRVRAGRIKPLAQTLIDLFDSLPAGGPLRIQKLDAPRLAQFTSAGWRLSGLAAVENMLRKFEGLKEPRSVAAPAGLALTLRPYQLEGLAWLQMLREQGLAGILADDMGLGKTAQTLAHILLEKEAGRLDRPVLIVLPTSLIFNWKAESQRFAPELSVLSLQGKARKESFAEIPHHDLVLTTYPLLWRDAEELARHSYHLLILDEAQTVKNAASQGATVVRRIEARHRLCLTGTPLENHLGELWSQFDFLLPGFLGEAKAFVRAWRTPIEKHGDRLRAQLLAARVRPFILRRRKEEVARELPAKTIMPRSIELEGSQRDLYEAVRSAMDARVREEIAAKGFARSQIVILDALLKLRQVCCDPRLVKSQAASRVSERAKLDHLMAMLPELVEEGRKVLVFSQFTGMLALIESELKQAGIDYALLTGETQDREGQIRRFQEGDTPVFLISLKAGGVGLNLTAADTVIHYDPWWNPAVENQATDRAHRIGQTKPVFVYKLIVAGSIEEKIVALQEQKAELANSILSDDHAGEVKFSEADIRALLEPLPVARP